MNAPGANSISVAELAMGLILALARHLPAADAAMKQGKWEKKKFLGEEVRDKTLGLAGLGRIGQEVARRAAAFGMRIIAHDPFISEQVAADLGVSWCRSTTCSRGPTTSRSTCRPTRRRATSSTPSGWHEAKKGIRIVNTARGDLVDEGALADAIEAGQVGGAALDVFDKEPTVDQRLQKLPQVVATPHIAASTREGQELVGVETAAALRDFLRDGVIRNAVNLPSVSAEEFSRLRPFLELGERLGVVPRADERRAGAGARRALLRRAGGRTERHDRQRRAGGPLQADPLVRRSRWSTRGPWPPTAASRSSSRAAPAPRNYTSLHVGEAADAATASGGWRAPSSSGRRPRLVLVDGIAVEAPLEGTMIVICNNDQPGRHRRRRHDPGHATA